MFVVYAMLAYLFVAMAIAWLVLRRTRRHDAAERFGPGRFGPGRFETAAGASGPDAHLLHRVTMRGRALRFYRSPLVGPDFPWAALGDLSEIAGGAREAVSAAWIYADHPTLARTLLTEGGAELLLSHWAGLELLTALASDSDRPALVAEFREAMAEAYVLQWADLTREQFLALCAQASRRPR